ncbi:biotin/lipoyl-containing protein [Flavobacterium sp. UBA6135]|jgi:biotin carboxyl carrier protein|uniref:biotin/lipoyl-containing protein n=1 Tax=Flavobacterium sp. UBA6135 TaxID=1946553 RepID=UPI0025B7B6BE|nr:acetyl-CoA carboxylase biotin carboxyl carrier protein subunit [Flavobacterium sp. UBA6135]
MNTKYKVKVNSNLEFELTHDAIKNLDSVSTFNSFHLLKNHKSFHASVVKTDFLKKRYTILVNENEYEIVIENELDQLIAAMGFASQTTKLVNEIKAPMPGLILEINVSVGQEVKENDNLLILEAMKMENSFSSPRDGIIKSIAVKKGDTVDKGQLLVEFE